MFTGVSGPPSWWLTVMEIWRSFRLDCDPLFGHEPAPLPSYERSKRSHPWVTPMVRPWPRTILKQLEEWHVIVSCDQFGETFRAAPTLLLWALDHVTQPINPDDDRIVSHDALCFMSAINPYKGIACSYATATGASRTEPIVSSWLCILKEISLILHVISQVPGGLLILI